MSSEESSLLQFTRYMHVAMRREWHDNWHQAEICAALERVVLGTVKRLIINVPPRSGKTELAVKMFMAWGMGINPASQFIHASYSKRLAAANTYAVRGMMQTEAYQAIFPVGLKEDSKAKDEFRTASGGVVYASGMAGTITGYGAGGMGKDFAGALIVDDPLKPGEVASDVVREGVNDWFQSTLESRKNSPQTPIIIIMQRLHERDLSGFLLAGGNGEEWTHLNIPARNEAGDSFWPRQFPAEMLDRLERTNPYVFAGQYMQRPTPPGGGDFKPQAIKIIDSAPAALSWFRAWDLAATTRKTSDYTASVRMAEQEGLIYIDGIDNFRGGPDEVEALILQRAKLDLQTRISIPQDPGQAGVSQKAALSRKLQGHDFVFSPESGDKRARAAPFAAQVNVGNVRIVNGPHVTEYLHQLETFPVGAHDDMVDASSRAYAALITQSTYTLSNL